MNWLKNLSHFVFLPMNMDTEVSFYVPGVPKE